MMSVASGLYYGIAKKVNRVHIAVPTIEAGDLPMTHWIDALAKILEDVALTGNGPRAVLSLSLYFHPNYMGANLQPMWIAKVNFILRRLIDRGVFVVAGSGNNGEVIDYSGWNLPMDTLLTLSRAKFSVSQQHSPNRRLRTQ